ncbi:GAF domain-containing sensor histidine kinase [Dyadobacter sediminis]|uniref:histidine kinase n=1 Tax=Dyadobacter sediminis TaxID=1493691 RepID=A0A5R9KGQ4_9BACT|nr:ATP-binding protein [Dyadobacter sediminis]TLU95323.1 PAS domain S-box protein [Dyadobacter sediminis]GGC16206.1 hypothetical protein GCM10011325_48750 [Dyadobacter sediminis]
MNKITGFLNENSRLIAVKSYDILDSLPEQDYDNITYLAAQFCQTPVSLISFIDDTREWFKSSHGLKLKEVSLSHSIFTHYTLNPSETFIITDLCQDACFAENPLVVYAPHMVFYAATPLIDEDGFVLGSLCVIDNHPRTLSQDQIKTLEILSGQVINLLKLRRKNKELNEKEADFRSLLSQAPVAIGLFVGKEMRVDLANDLMISYWGKGPCVIGKPLIEIIPEIKEQGFLEILNNVLETDVPYITQNTIAQLEIDGVLGSYYFDFIYQPIHDQKGSVYAVMNIAVDVTDRVLTQQKIDLAQQQILTSFEESPVAIALIDEFELTYRMANPFYCQLVGRTPEQLINKPLLIAVPEIKEQGFDQILKNVIATGISYIAPEVSVDLIRDSKLETIYVNLTYQPRRQINGEISGVLVIATDVSMQVRSRQKIEISENKYKQLTVELEGRVKLRTQELTILNEDLLRLNDNLRQFAYIASHDLQEPLRKIQTFSSILSENLADKIDENSIDLLNRINVSGQRMSALIKDLHKYSLVDSRKQKFGLVSLNTVLMDVLEILNYEIRKYNATIEFEQLGVVEGDKSQLMHLFQNLISNAIKFTRPNENPRISIEYFIRHRSELPKHLVFSSNAPLFHQINVKDEGIGFDIKYLDRIFQVFQRLHTKNEFQGTGVGLAICERVVLNHNGVITAISELGQGATFCVYLPGFPI